MFHAKNTMYTEKMASTESANNAVIGENLDSIATLLLELILELSKQRIVY